MQILAIDTASPRPAVSLLANGALFEETLPSDRRSSEALLPAISRVLAAAKTRLEDCTRFAVCSGPGSFTGIRIGLATAWGLSRVSGVPVEAVSTLECIAEAASDASVRPRTLSAVLDAGRGEVVMERFALGGGESRARSLAPAVRVPIADLRAASGGDPLVELPAGLSGATALVPGRTPASALALAVARAPRPPSAVPAAASYSRPSAAEERHGPS